MGADELCARAASEMSFGGPGQVPYSDFQQEGQPGRAVMNAIAEAERRMADMPLEIIDTGGITISRLQMEVRRAKRRMAAKGEKLELVVIDYVQLVRSDNKGHSPYERVSEVSMAMKALAKDNEVAVLALAQLSRSVESRPDKRPMLSDLRDSGQLEQDADLILFLLREEYYLRKEKAEGWEAAIQAVQNEIEFICAKRRHGVEGSAKGYFYGQYQAVRG
jgi:replicative DNA helicase